MTSRLPRLRLNVLAHLRQDKAFLSTSCLPNVPLPPLGYVYLNRVSYPLALRLQETLVRQRLNSRANNDDPDRKIFDTDVLLLLEHPPTYTAGRRQRGKVPEEEEMRLRELGAEFYQSPRGGQTTFHGPGQLIGYPLIDLRQSKLGARCYVSLLEKSLIEICRRKGIAARITENTGVWVGGCLPTRLSSDREGTENNFSMEEVQEKGQPERKIAAIGVHVTQAITQHGFALNVTTDLTWFNHIVPCGLIGLSATSLEKELEPAKSTGVVCTVESLVSDVTASFGDVFDRSMKPLNEIAPALETWIRSFLRRGGNGGEGI